MTRPVAAARREHVVALGLDLIGAAVALLVAGRAWQAVTIPRSGLQTLRLSLTGRTVDGAGTALALAALAAVVALLATRGVVRRAIGALTAVVGVLLVVRSLAATSPLDAARARRLVADHFHGAVLDGATPHVDVHAVWPWFSAACGLLIALAGVVVAVRGHRWQALSGRYQTPAVADRAAEDAAASDNPAAADLAMWKALDRGDDPTA